VRVGRKPLPHVFFATFSRNTSLNFPHFVTQVSQQIRVHRDSCSFLLGSHQKRTAWWYELKRILEFAERIPRLYGAENTLRYTDAFKIEKVSNQNKK
jgi:hypothetical protein